MFKRTESLFLHVITLPPLPQYPFHGSIKKFKIRVSASMQTRIGFDQLYLSISSSHPFQRNKLKKKSLTLAGEHT